MPAHTTVEPPGPAKHDLPGGGWMTTSDDAYMTPQGLLQRIHDEREALAATWGALTME
jgi:hypothetical protein